MITQSSRTPSGAQAETGLTFNEISHLLEATRQQYTELLKQLEELQEQIFDSSLDSEKATYSAEISRLLEELQKAIESNGNEFEHGLLYRVGLVGVSPLLVMLAGLVVSVSIGGLWASLGIFALLITLSVTHDEDMAFNIYYGGFFVIPAITFFVACASFLYNLATFPCGPDSDWTCQERKDYSEFPLNRLHDDHWQMLRQLLDKLQVLGLDAEELRGVSTISQLLSKLKTMSDEYKQGLNPVFQSQFAENTRQVEEVVSKVDANIRSVNASGSPSENAGALQLPHSDQSIYKQTGAFLSRMQRGLKTLKSLEDPSRGEVSIDIAPAVRRDNGNRDDKQTSAAREDTPLLSMPLSPSFSI